MVGSMRRHPQNYYVNHESEVSVTFDDGTEDSCSDLSFVVPDSDVEYIESASPQTPIVSPSRLSARYEQVRRSRRCRSSHFVVESSSDFDRSPSPCSRMRSHGENSFMTHQDSLSGRLESAILALDQLKSCLQGVKMEIEQVVGEDDDYRP